MPGGGDGLDERHDADDAEDADDATDANDADDADDLRAIVRHVPDVLVRLDAARRIRFASPALERLLDRPAAALVGQPLTSLVAGETVALDAWLEALAADGDVAPARVTLSSGGPGGPSVPFELHGAAVGPGARGGFVVSARDARPVVALEEERRRLHAALEASEGMFRTLAEAAPAAVFRMEPGARLGYVNARWEEMTGQPAEEALGTGWLRLATPADRTRVRQVVRRAEDAGREWQVRVRVQRPDGTAGWLQLQAAPIASEAGDRGYVGTAVDTTAETEARREADRLTTILEATTDVVVLARVDGRILWANERARLLLGVTRPDAPTDVLEVLDVLDLLAPEDRDRYRSEVVPTVLDRGSWRGELTVRSAAGMPMRALLLVMAHRDRNGELQHLSLVARDISDLAEVRRSLEHLALHDPLTGVPNRTLFWRHLTLALATSGEVAVLYCDLDEFKPVNDRLGHEQGDAILRRVARRMVGAVRDHDVVARLGGDEFTVLCEGRGVAESAPLVADRILAALSAPFELGHETVRIGVSIGVATSLPGDGTTPDGLVRRADLALYEAKRRGRGVVVIDEDGRGEPGRAPAPLSPG